MIVQKQVTLLSVIPYDCFKQIEQTAKTDLTHCMGTVEKENQREIWFGFVNHVPMRVTHRETDKKTTWSTCNLEMVKSKLKQLI